MPSVPTRRLIDAVATLDPADRALLNLWINRALPDAELMRLTRLSPGALSARRERIVERLGATLGLPEPDVAQALAALTVAEPAAPAVETAAAPEAAPTVEPDSTADAAAPPAPDVPAPAPADAPAESEAPPESPETGTPGPRHSRRSDRSRRRGLLGALGLLGILVVAGIVVALAGGGGRGHTGAARARTSATSRGHASTSHTTVALAPLPGGPPHAQGTLDIIRSGSTLTLDLRVSLLPAAPGGSHYEAWLYRSVVSSIAVGEIDPATGRLTAQLPAGASAYPWIDVSVQGAGSTVHSGVSVLRAANPLARTGG